MFDPATCMTKNGFFLVSLTIFIACQASGKEPFRQIQKGFIENKGQILDQDNKANREVLYLLNMAGMNVQIRRGGFSYDLYAPLNDTSCSSENTSSLNVLSFMKRERTFSRMKDSVISERENCMGWGFHRIDFDFAGSNPGCEIVPSGPSSDYLNYYTTGTPVQGVIHVRSYSSVTCKNIYPGIDIEFVTDNARGFKYNIVVHPGSDLASVKMSIKGTDVRITPAGTLMLKTTQGAIEEKIPSCHYLVNGVAEDISCSFRKAGWGLYGFATDKPVPRTCTLIIDPIPWRLWGTYYGGPASDDGNQSVMDHSGHIIIYGHTSSLTNIATAGAYQTTNMGNQDAFFVKFNSEGFAEWATYFGGSSYDEAYDCAIDDSNSIYLTGTTSSVTNIATPGAFMTTLNGGDDAFLVRFDSTGSRIWSTYYGGNSIEDGDECATDHYGHVYLCGTTSSDNGIATPGTYQPNFGGASWMTFDAFIVQFSTQGQRNWGTYYGGAWDEWTTGCTADSYGNILIAGQTSSLSGIASPGAHQEVIGNNPTGLYIHDGFLGKFDSTGQRLWGTYYGGEVSDAITDVSMNNAGDIYVSGQTVSVAQISTPGSFQSAYGGGDYDGFLAKFSPLGQRLWGTYIGGTGYDYNIATMSDDSSYLFTCGVTTSANNIATQGAYQENIFGSTGTAYVMKFAPDGRQIWGTYYGDSCFGGSIIPYGDTLFLCGAATAVTKIATPGSYQPVCSGSQDAYLVKLVDCYPPGSGYPPVGPGTFCRPANGVVYSISPIAHATGYAWTVPSGATIVSGQNTTSITVDFGPVASSGAITVQGMNTCGTGEQFSLDIQGLVRPVPVIAGNDTSCKGLRMTYTTEAGKLNYIWLVSGGGVVSGGGSPADNFIQVTWNVVGPQWISVTYADTNGCAAADLTVKNVLVTGGAPVNVSAAVSQNPVCAGMPVTFTANTSNAGSVPTYEWKINAVNAGNATNSVFTYTPVNGDVVTCEVFSSESCVSGNPGLSNAILMSVNQLLPVGVSIVASENPCCASSSVSFTATPANGGLNPVYRWKVNAVTAGNATNSVFTYIPVDGDIVTCELTSSEICNTGSPAMSNAITMVLNTNLPAGVTIAASANPFCPGTSVTFTATTVNGGNSPTYQWKINGVNAANASNSVYAYTPAAGDLISCVLTSNLNCVTANPATSPTINMIGKFAPDVSFTDCFDTITTLSAKPYLLRGGFPAGGLYSGPGVNSATGIFTPSAAGIGPKTITYSYSNVYACMTFKTKVILVLSNPTFTCGNNFIDFRDNKVYSTVEIGTQCWMSSNLDFGSTIDDLTPQTDNCVAEKYIRYSTFNIRYSIFYQWDELMRYATAAGSQGLCPPGWHIPTSAEWDQLLTLYDGPGQAAGPMKDTLLVNGFHSFQNGLFYLNNTWAFTTGLYAGSMYWTSTLSGNDRATARGLNQFNQSVSRYAATRTDAFGVRCVRDQEE
jgi:uncharacterized protein (TIGR02145 family)